MTEQPQHWGLLPRLKQTKLLRNVGLMCCRNQSQSTNTHTNLNFIKTPAEMRAIYYGLFLLADTHWKLWYTIYQ